MPHITIDDSNYHLYLPPPVINGERKGMGQVPRDFNTHPVGYCGVAARPFDLPLIDNESEQEDRLREQLKNDSHMETARNTGMNGQMIPSRDQNGIGYCWCHSVTSGILLIRAFNGQPYEDLSAFSIGCMIKNFRDEGGWNAEAMDFLFNKGIATSKTWPQKSMSKANDKPETWQEAAQYRGVEGMDLDPRNMKVQLITCLLTPGIVVASDFNWWGHSVLTVRLLSLKPFKTRIWNSWTDQWSTNGMGDLEGSKAIPNAATALRVVSAAA